MHCKKNKNLKVCARLTRIRMQESQGVFSEPDPQAQRLFTKHINHPSRGLVHVVDPSDQFRHVALQLSRLLRVIRRQAVQAQHGATTCSDEVDATRHRSVAESLYIADCFEVILRVCVIVFCTHTQRVWFGRREVATIRHFHHILII